MKKQKQLFQIPDLTDIKKILRIVWGCSQKWTLARIILVVVQTVLPLIPLYLLKLLIDALSSINQGQSFEYILWIIGGVAIIQVLTILIGVISTYVNFWHNEVVTDHMSDLVAQKSMTMDFAYFDINQFYDIFQRAMTQAKSRPMAVLGTCIGLGKNILAIIAVAGLLMTLHWGIIVFIIILGLPATYIQFRFSQENVELTERQTPNQRKAGLFNGMLSGRNFAKELRIYGYGPTIKKQYLSLLRQLREERRNLKLSQSYKMAAWSCVQTIAVLGGVVYVAYEAFQQNITLGDVAFYFALFQKGQSEIKAFMNTGVALNDHALYLRHLFEFLELAPRIVSPSNPKALPAKVSTLKIDNVTFTYPNTKRMVLKGISCSFKKGELIAIVGENGSGKTTLVKLLNRLYDVGGGSIQLEDTNIQNFDLSAYRGKVSTIFQHFARYDLPVDQNIFLADTRKAINPEKIKEVSQFAKADAFIEALPNKYQTQLGRAFWTGEELSGGQWQKLALARSLYKTADILILDEPTSHIDPLAEEAIFKNLLAVAKDKILILVTHRIYNLTLADKIIVMDQGTIVEQGSHIELMESKGKYYQMFRSQEVAV